MLEPVQQNLAADRNPGSIPCPRIAAALSHSQLQGLQVTLQERGYSLADLDSLPHFVNELEVQNGEPVAVVHFARGEGRETHRIPLVEVIERYGKKSAGAGADQIDLAQAGACFPPRSEW